jgi:hypothetical protein
VLIGETVAELKQKAEKAKDAGVTRMANTRDKYSSVPSAKTNWDPNWKRPPPSAPTGSASTYRNGPPSPPPLQTRPDTSESMSSSITPPPPVPRGSRPDTHSPSSYSPLPPPPTRLKSAYPPQTGSTEQVDHIDWANLSQEDKDEFFSWLDEFFSRYFNIALPAKRELPLVGMKGSLPSTSGPPVCSMMSFSFRS